MWLWAGIYAYCVEMSEDNLEYNLQALSTFLLRQFLIGLELTEHSEPPKICLSLVPKSGFFTGLGIEFRLHYYTN